MTFASYDPLPSFNVIRSKSRVRELHRVVTALARHTSSYLCDGTPGLKCHVTHGTVKKDTPCQCRNTSVNLKILTLHVTGERIAAASNYLGADVKAP